jgi:hypothetical protein
MPAKPAVECGLTEIPHQTGVFFLTKADDKIREILTANGKPMAVPEFWGRLSS